MLGMSQQGRQREQVVEATEETSTDPAVVAAAASVVLSWHQFFVAGNREMGLFVALWPPTILAFASYFEQSRMGRQVKRALGGSSLRNTVEEMMGSR